MIDPIGGEARDLDQGRQIRFVVTPTGVRVAYAIVGRGPALIVPAAWIGHLEIAWQDPAVRAFYAPIVACRTAVAYDKPGCGLSDPWPAPQTLDSDLEVLRTVIDHSSSAGSTCSVSQWGRRCRWPTRFSIPKGSYA